MYAARCKGKVLAHAVMALSHGCILHALSMAQLTVKEASDEELPSLVLVPPYLGHLHLRHAKPCSQHDGQRVARSTLRGTDSLVGSLKCAKAVGCLCYLVHKISCYKSLQGRKYTAGMCIGLSHAICSAAQDRNILLAETHEPNALQLADIHKMPEC